MVHLVLVVEVVTMEEVDQGSVLFSVLVEVIYYLIMIDFLFYINIYTHFIGGSSYIGGCNAAYDIAYLPGVTSTTNTETMPGGSTRSDYIPGVGVGNVGAYNALQSPGGNGAIVLTFHPSPTAPPSTSPSLSPTSAVPLASTSTVVLPILSSGMIAAVGGFVVGITLMIMLYFCTRASKHHSHRAEYTPVLREVFFTTTGSVKGKHKVVTRRIIRI